MIQFQILLTSETLEAMKGLNNQEMQVQALGLTPSMTLNDIYNLLGPPYSETRELRAWRGKSTINTRTETPRERGLCLSIHSAASLRPGT